MSVTELTKKERDRIRRSTLGQRAAFIGERRAVWRERDEARFRLGADLDAAVTVPRSLGYEVVAPGFPGAAEVVSATNALIDGIGGDELIERNSKKGSKVYMATGFLPDDAFRLGSPYFRFAFSPQVVGSLVQYFGFVPILHKIDAWYSIHSPDDPIASQQWHLDHDDTELIKVWVYCSDVGMGSGPLTLIGADDSEAIANRIGHSFAKGEYRVADDKFANEELIPLTGETGTTAFVDTCRCFHFGSRVDAGAEPRRVVVFHYLTPYSFIYEDDHREEAPYRKLAKSAPGELERLLLGAD